MKQKKNNKGFTFIELLVCMTILSMIVIYVVCMLNAGIVSSNRGNAEIRVQTNAQQSYNQIADSIMQATTVEISDGSTVYIPQATFDGLTSSEQAGKSGYASTDVTVKYLFTGSETYVYDASAGIIYLNRGTTVDTSMVNKVAEGCIDFTVNAGAADSNMLNVSLTFRDLKDYEYTASGTVKVRNSNIMNP